MFLFAIFDITDHLSTLIIFFSDGKVIIAVHKNVHIAGHCLPDHLNTLQTWLASGGLKSILRSVSE